ncbi:MAG: hypothetical protein HN350_17270 [Phycisphaerales bacterium]|jgi:hypothetical protein|nr:hypothetical protein [Phycisphaerales bacterium]
MKRICIINVAGLSPDLLSRQGDLWFGSLTPAADGAMTPTMPSVPASVQASMTTGRLPGEHGVVAGGVFRRQSRNLSIAERSNTLLTKKRFWHSRHLPEKPKVALVFWSNPLAGGGDIVLGAASYACHCGKVSNQPVGLYDRLTETCGQFDCANVSGPTASWKASQWIAESAGNIWRDDQPDLMWVNLPGVNYELIRGGVADNATAVEALADVDKWANALSDAVCAQGGQVIVVSDGGYTDVNQAVCPNIALREAGMLCVKETDDGLEVDIEASDAVALVDHQVAHLYCDEELADKAAAVLAPLEGVESVLPRSEVFAPGLGHDRAGERIIIAKPGAWMAPRWCSADEKLTPQAAQSPLGYDPCELISDQADETSVRASRGLVDGSPETACFLGATFQLPAPQEMCVTELPDVLKKVMFE